MKESIESLSRRIIRLQRFTAALFAAVVGLVAAILIAATSVPATAQAQAFQLVDEFGVVHAELVVRDGTPGLHIRDVDGVDRISLFHAADADALFIRDGEGVTRVGVAQFAHGGGGFALHGPQSEGGAVLYYKTGGSLQFFDEEGVVTTRFPDAE